jgi:hypothetical protein
MPNDSQPDLLDALGGALTPQALLALAKQLGLGLDDVTKLVKAILPTLLERLQSNADQGDGAAIAAAVDKDHDGSVLDDAVGFLGGGFLRSSGGGILGHVFGDQLDATAKKISTDTQLPEGAVRMAMTALAPMAMGAIAKVAIGAVTAAGVAAVLALAVQGIRSGKVQRVIGNLNDRLDDDGDGNALDDVGRDAVGVAKRGGAAVANAAKKVTSNPKVRETASTAATKTKQAASKVRDGAKKRWKKWFG